jgi:hypothetical protein
MHGRTICTPLGSSVLAQRNHLQRFDTEQVFSWGQRFWEAERGRKKVQQGLQKAFLWFFFFFLWFCFAGAQLFVRRR